MNQLRIALAAFPLVTALALPATPGEVHGRLLLASRPATGVTISAVPWETPGEEARREVKGGEAPKPYASVAAGADGSFLLSVPAEAGREKAFRVRVEGEGAVPILYETVFDASDSEDLGDVTLVAARKLSGVVLDAKGSPLAGADVTLSPGLFGAEDPALRPAPRLTVTGADGAFRFDGAGARGNVLTVEKKGFAPVRLSGLQAGPLASPVRLDAGFPLSGTVRRADRKPAAGALVRLDGGRAPTRWVETDEAGRFTLAHAPRGRASVVVDAGEAGWCLSPDVKLPLAAGKSVLVSLALPASLEGRIVEEKTGRAVPRARVLVKGVAFERLSRNGADGRYRLAGLPPGRFRLTVDESRSVRWARPDLDLAPGEARKLDIALTPGATLAGKVVDEAGAPVAAARGTLARGGESALAGVRRMLRAEGDAPAFRTRTDGTFGATRLAPGDDQRLFVSHPEFERALLSGLALPPGGTKANVRVVLRRGATLAGVVKDTNDQPIPDVEIEVDPSAGLRAGGRPGLVANLARALAPAERPRGKTGADGRFGIKGIGLGEYAVVLRKPGYATERVDPVRVTEQGAEPVTVTLGPGASLSGVVKRRSGEGAEGFTVRVGGRPGGGAGGGASGGELPTGPDGAFVLDGLKPQLAYELSVTGGAGIAPPKRVVAPATGIEIVVSGTGRISGSALDARTGRALTSFAASFEPERGGGGPGGGRGRGGPGGPGAAPDAGAFAKRFFQADDGAFTLEDVPPGTWTVVVEARGYRPARVTGVVVEEGATKANVEVRATLGAVLEGRVTDARSARPVPNAAVLVEAAAAGRRGGGGDPLALMNDEVTTDADGAFRIEGLTPGHLKVTAKSPDYADGSEVAEVTDAGGRVEIELVAGGSAAGVVVSAGQPLPNADVSLAAAGEAGFGRVLAGSQTTTTDASGRFRFDHLSEGRFSVSAAHRGKSSARESFVLQAGDSKEDLVLSLGAGTTIQGTVTGLPAAWRNGVTVTASGVEGFSSTTRAGGDGAFQVSGLPAGPVTLRAQANDGLGATRSATKQVTAADDVPVLQAEIVFEVGFDVSGHVTRGGRPAAGATVVANRQGGGGRQASARTDDSGAYALSGLQEGRYTVTATADALAGGLASTVRQSVTVTGDQTLDLAFAMAKVSGIVTDAATKQPLPDASVSLTAAPGAPGAGMRRATTDSNGRFTFADVAPQSYTLNAQKADYQLEKRTVAAADDGSSDDLSIALARGEGIGIQVRDGLSGLAMRGVTARAVDSGRATVFAGAITLDTTGVGEIPSLAPGTYTLYVNASGYATAALSGVAAPSRLVPVTLTPGGAVDIAVGPKSFVNGTLRATLTTAAGVPYPYTLFATDGRIAVSADTTGQAGFRRIPNLAPGTYALAPDGGGRHPFTVTEGGVTPLALP